MGAMSTSRSIAIFIIFSALLRCRHKYLGLRYVKVRIASGLQKQHNASRKVRSWRCCHSLDDAERDATSNGFDIEEVRDAVRTIELATTSIEVSTKKLETSLETLAKRSSAWAVGRAESDRPRGHDVRLARQKFGVSA
jgi:hypothetical protein